ncbi:hypothetical protein H6G54_25470 [Anabaena cylindrica FACHB-243]|uniref:Uncharacterized protein n=1 Tax=Anabaena cylindrica (strain ATCC 27899 / PCC 7122) TaxID=272123 RepID=K9ZF04_ANACC|nr:MULTISPECIES: hypothetical protein [Anabaena]AFZ57319.1 hypothetical protein Anacy_1829 [Anabaena cylindrica PCC 7122]MBD2420987.1 hypothetical protein [Anabaena cylindrica FACHB-243]MBY5284745.1 hypothetical protein [Anabaena sp. CCAP 1446/1C]MBY5308339.1 hypothetical protein [Anabaena sp. CCAP 1446/1C]MCM2405740.1 hypothetical protein [Anabaena sp. CCAP 1446/1C]
MQYLFENKLGTHYIDLKKLELVENATPDELEDFKKQSQFAFVFRRKDLKSVSVTKQHQFNLSGENNSTPESGVSLYKNHQSKESLSIPLGKLLYSYYLITTQDKVIVWEDDWSIHYRLRCFDEDLNLIWQKSLVTQVDDQADIQYLMHNDKTIYYWVFKGDICRYELFTMDIQTSEISNILLELPHNVCSVLIDDQANDIGLLELNKTQNSFQVNYGAEKYNLPLPSVRQNYYKEIKIEGILYHKKSGYGDFFRALSNKVLKQKIGFFLKRIWSNASEPVPILWIVYYDPTASGATLYAYDFKQQVLLWQHEITKHYVDQSNYWNKIYLILDEDKIILEGKEAGTEYVQIFEATTGRKIFSIN